MAIYVVTIKEDKDIVDQSVYGSVSALYEEELLVQLTVKERKLRNELNENSRYVHPHFEIRKHTEVKRKQSNKLPKLI